MISKTLLQFFPPPKFLSTPYAGLAMSDKHIRTIQFEETGRDNLKIKTYAELPLPEGAITGGRVNNKEEIVAVLKELKKKTGIEYVRVSIPEEKAYLFEIEIPVVEPKEVKSTIEFKLEENVPWPADKVVFDYSIIENNPIQGHIKAVVSALPSKFVDIYMDLFSSSGFLPYVFEIESQAIARALLSPDDLDIYLIAHFHKDRVGLCIVSGGIVHFTSTLNLSGNWHDNFPLIASEMKKVMVYWQTNRPEGEEKKSVTKIFISGDILGDSTASQLSSLLKIDVTIGNVWRNAFDINKVLPEISFIESLKYASAVGLALPSESLI